MKSDRTDDELVIACESGDEAAFAELVERYLPSVYSFAARLSGSPDDAEDAAQQTFVKAWQHLRRFKKGMRMKTWLFAIARNTVIDSVRKKKPALFSEFENEERGSMEERIADTGPSAEIAFDDALQHEVLEDALRQLALPYREIILLHYREGLTLDEAAKALGIPLNTAKSRDRRALITLRKILGPKKA